MRCSIIVVYVLDVSNGCCYQPVVAFCCKVVVDAKTTEVDFLLPLLVMKKRSTAY